MAMFHSSQSVPMGERTVGVVHCDSDKTCPGYTLLSAGRETFLLDGEGRVVHEWRADRVSFCSYLLPNGDLLRDGSERELAPLFRAGGAAGYIEQVSWDNELKWSFNIGPYTRYLSHHDLEPLPNGNVLMLAWERKSKSEALQAGRRPELIPDGEVWDNLVLELKPDGRGGADVVWRWSVWDHLVQDYDESKDNFGDVRRNPQLFDVNYCPPGGKAACRNRTLLPPPGPGAPKPATGVPAAHSGKPLTGEKDWIHANAVAYDAARDVVLVSFNVPSEVVVVDHSTSKEEAQTHAGGKRGKGGDILYRFGNPQVSRAGTAKAQGLFCQHSAYVVRATAPHVSGGGAAAAAGAMHGEGNLILFNNGRQPDRHWSTVDEYQLPSFLDEPDSAAESASAVAPPTCPRPVWTYGARAGRLGSFYCTHISGVQRLPNGNTLITMGPQGILSEVTRDGVEVWRYVSPVIHFEEGAAVCFVRQGDERVAGRFSLFRALRYCVDHPALAPRAAELRPGRFLEA